MLRRSELHRFDRRAVLTRAGTARFGVTCPPSHMRDVLAFFSDAGGGHRNAVNALLAAAEEIRPPFRLLPRNLSEVLAEFDLLRRFGRRSIEETYNELLRTGRTRHLVPLLRVLHAASWLLHRPMVRALARQLAAQRPAAVLSVHPNFNALLRDATRRALPGVPFMVLMTDYADFPPHFWIETGVDRLIVGSARARDQALEQGLPAERVSLSSGMVVNPRFHRTDLARARAALRAELALPEQAFVVLPCCSAARARPRWRRRRRPCCRPTPRGTWSRSAARTRPCSSSSRARAAGGAPRLRGGGVTGFTDRVAEFMAAADVLLAKPGPGSLAEAFACRLPLVVTCNPHTIPQERHNADMLAETGLGLVVRDWSEMPAAAVRVAREPGLHARLRERLVALPPNRAVDEALEVIGRELDARRGAANVSLIDFGWDDGWARAFVEHAPAGSEPARVTAELGPFLRVMVEAGELLAERSGRLRHDAETRSELPVVGDWVALRRAAGAERGQVVAVLPRRSRFARKAAGEDVREQVLAANIDTVFLVAGLDRDFNPRRLERALLLARENGATPVVVLNKSDLAGDPAARRREIEAVAQGAPVIVTAARAGLGLGDLAPFLQPGRTVALLGSSGVGKSTLINRLLGFEKQRTRDVREVDSRGRHTTTHRELVLLPEGGVLIDTPGMRELQLWASEQSMGGTFDDVAALGAGCGVPRLRPPAGAALRGAGRGRAGRTAGGAPGQLPEAGGRAAPPRAPARRARPVRRAPQVAHDPQDHARGEQAPLRRGPNKTPAQLVSPACSKSRD